VCHRLCSRSGAAARMNPDYSFGRRRSRRYCPYLVIPAKRRPRSGRLEGRTTLIQPKVDFLTAMKAGIQWAANACQGYPWMPAFAGVTVTG
jgi:hypothetical protein